MSKYHEKCCQACKPQEKNKIQKAKPLKYKPFCDCNDCSSLNCPDILERLAITLTDTTCYFGENGAVTYAKDACTGYEKVKKATSNKVVPQGTSHQVLARSDNDKKRESAHVINTHSNHKPSVTPRRSETIKTKTKKTSRSTGVTNIKNKKDSST